ncbi:hypothetical protein M3661_24750 [Paenibacillus sp. MER 180]|uniref:sirohydrochlorin chelatase n=1 Tax=Paenibacillus sp. MER 180 TaxID=2939570 RepID=UPI0020413346|nr:CbiX/SirB N-terminal domain-containing protein [Paenibacillus sp. MER 180]MCM3293321.1 hypothetical protein [Paenibacillus sp. MER 180]
MKPGLLIISHGSRDESWVTLVEEAIAQTDWPDGVAVVSSYLECLPEQDIQYGINTLEAQGVNHIGVIPLFVSAGSTHADEIAYALGAKPAPLCETDLEPFRVQARVYYGRPLDGGNVVPLQACASSMLGEGIEENGRAVESSFSAHVEQSGDGSESGSYLGLSAQSDRSCSIADVDSQEDVLLQMVEERLRGLGVRPDSDAVLLVAHGSRYEPFASRWHESLRRLERKLVLRGTCAGASHALLCCEDIAEAVSRLQSVLTLGQDEIVWSGRAEQLTVPLDSFGGMDVFDGHDGGGHSCGEQTVERRVAVVPVFLSRGYFTSHVIPQRLGDVSAMYDGEALLPHSALNRWLQQEAVRLLAMMKGNVSQ